jgi:CheY-like chemotaxis protein
MLDRLLGEHIRLRLVPRPNLPAVEADPSMIEQVVLNLAVNARDAMPKFGTLTITTHTIELDRLEGSRHKNAQPGRYACISVHDTGTGISAETLEHIFEPFFTTKEAGKGTGLGLATVDGILEQHKGWIEVTSIPGEGSEFRVYLPAGSGAVEPKAPPAAEPKAASGHETLLLVEDEDVVRNLLRTYLGRQGYRVISAQSAPQALELFRREPQHFAALITDMVMPGGMTGRELADHVRQLRPDIPLIFMSGYSLEFASDGLPVGHGVRFLCKPFEPSELGRTVREVLDLPPTGGTRNARPAVVKANA